MLNSFCVIKNARAFSSDLKECFAVRPDVDGMLDVARKTFLQSMEDIYLTADAMTEENGYQVKVGFEPSGQGVLPRKPYPVLFFLITMISAVSFNISSIILVRSIMRPTAIPPCFHGVELSATDVSGFYSVFCLSLLYFSDLSDLEKRWHVRLPGDTTWSSPPGSATFQREYVKPSRTSRRFRVQRKRSVKAWYNCTLFEAS